MATYSIRDLEKISGIKAHTIRVWEKRYGLIRPERTQTNIRYYDDSDLRKILNISILVRNGIKISKIALFRNEDLGEKVMLVSQKLGKTDDTLENLILSMINFDEDKLERQISNLIMKFGFEETFTQYIQPFFERIGVLWQTGTIVPAQEHFVSNIVRQKLIVAIDTHRVYENSRITNFVLFLPEGEFHELGLLFMQYVLRKRGFNTIYLGQSVPLSDLERVKKTMNNIVPVCSISTTMTAKQLADVLQKVATIFEKNRVLVAGTQVSAISLPNVHNLFILKSYNEFIHQLDNFQ